MTSTTKDRTVTFDCDGDGCHKNVQGDRGEDFRAVWAGAKSYGWVNSVEYEGNVSRWKHYCPDCKKGLGD